jgi:hypothetical protein
MNPVSPRENDVRSARTAAMNDSRSKPFVATLACSNDAFPRTNPIITPVKPIWFAALPSRSDILCHCRSRAFSTRSKIRLSRFSSKLSFDATPHSTER